MLNRVVRASAAVFQHAREYGRVRVRRSAVILSYHRIYDAESDAWDLCVSPRHFAEHLEVLSTLGRTIRLQDLVAAITDGEVPRRSFVITFDDGYRDNLDTAKPLLDRHDAPATIFVSSGLLAGEQEPWWDELERLVLRSTPVPEGYREWRAWKEPVDERQERFQQLWTELQPLSGDDRLAVLEQVRQSTCGVPPNGRSMLSHDELVALAADGRIEIGAHTVNHPQLSALSLGEQRTEIEQSKLDLQEVLGRPVRSFAYPFGQSTDYSSETVEMVRQAGFTCACCNFPGTIAASSDLFQLPRRHVGNWDGDTFARHLYRWLSE